MNYKLSELCEYVKGKVNVEALNSTNYVSTENMLPNKEGIVQATTLPSLGQTQIFKSGDVLVSNIRPYFRKIWYAQFDGGCSNDVLVFRAKEGVNDRFLYYVLANDSFFDYSMATSKGTKMPRGDKSSLMKYEIRDVAYKNQDKIAEILEVLDQKIQVNKQINDNLEEQIEALLLNCVNNNDTFPVKLGDYLYIKGRIGWKGLKKSEYLDHSNFRIINGETLTQSGIDWNKAGYISEERYAESPEIMLSVGDILLSKDGTIGKIGYVDNLELPTSVASGIFVIRNNKPQIISTTFIYYLLKSTIFKSFIAARTEGSVIPHLYQKDFMDFEFPLPSSNLMAKFEEIAEPMFSKIIANLNENKVLVATRETLLPKLMSGEIDVSNIPC